LPEKFLCGKLFPYKFSVSWLLIINSHELLKHEDFLFFGGENKFILEKKSHNFYSDSLMRSLNRKQKCRNFCARVFRDFPPIFDRSKFWGCASIPSSYATEHIY